MILYFMPGDVTMRQKRKSIARFIFLLLIAFFGSVAIILWQFGSLFIGPFPNFHQPVSKDFPVEVISFKDEAGTGLKGWFVYGIQGRGVVLLLHGHGGHKSMSLDRVRFLHEAGYSVFVFDFQGHGESEQKNSTLGYQEAANVRAALDIIRERLPMEKIAIIGPSLGGAALLVKGQVIAADAYILEGVYPSLAQTGEHRFAEVLGGQAAHWLLPLLVGQVRWRLGFDPDLLRPIDSISELKAPVLIIGGSKDPHVLPKETRALYEKAPEPKELWMVEGAGHFDFYLHAPQAYQEHVLGFLKKYFDSR